MVASKYKKNVISIQNLTHFNAINSTILEYDIFSRDETFDCFVTLWLNEHDFRAENPILLFLLESKKNV